MKLFQSFFWAAVGFTTLGAARGGQQEINTYHRQFLASSPLKLDDKIYESLTKTPRNHTFVALLTALENRFGCQLCKDFQSEWDILASSAAKASVDPAQPHIYGTLDFTDGKGTFQMLMLQTAPIILLFPPTQGVGARPDGTPIRYDFTAGPQTAEQIQNWIKRNAPGAPSFAIRRPINYVRIITITTIVLGLVSFLSLAYPYILPVIQSRGLWAGVSLITVLLFTSGHMFNHIRKVPYISGDGKGGISYFAGGFSNQFGMETQIVAAMYGVLAFATIALALKAPRIVDPKRQQAAVILWGVVSFGMYGTLLSIFRVKNAGYPFYLPPF